MMKKFHLCIFIILSFSAVRNYGARILAVFPTPSISHQVVFRPLTQELARRGHELVIVTTDPAYAHDQAPPNITEIDLHDVSYNYFREHFTKKVRGNSDDAYKLVEAVFRVLNDVFELQLQTREFKNLIKSNASFDLIFVEAFARPALAVSHVFKAPVVQISSFGALPSDLQVIGAPSHPIFYPAACRKRVYNLTLWEKLRGVYEEFLLRNLLWRLEGEENRMIKKYFGTNAPTISELSNNVEMIFVNVDHMWDANRPAPPGLIYLGGMHQNPQKNLPRDLNSFLDGSKHGVIYISFGTNVDPSQLPHEIIQVFTKVFSSLPYDVLWKWNANQLPGKPDNLRISKWLPQSDLLKHPKVKLFITQAGLQSSDEAISAGVPLLAFPMLGDQWYNAEQIVHHDIGLTLDITTITEDTLREAINLLIQDERYRRNIKRIDALRRDRPDTALERAVWWTEYVLRHRGAKHLRSAAAAVSWQEYLMLDVLAFVATSTLLLVTIGTVLIRSVYVRLISGSVKLKSL